MTESSRENRSPALERSFFSKTCSNSLCILNAKVFETVKRLSCLSVRGIRSVKYNYMHAMTSFDKIRLVCC